MARPAPLGDASAPPLRVIFFVNRWSYFRFFESALEALLQRGHELVLVVERDLEDEYQGEWVRALERNPRFSSSQAWAFRTDPMRFVRGKLRRTVDYLHFLRPRFDRAPWLRQRAVVRTPAWVVWATRTRLLRGRRARGLLTRTLEFLDHALPAPRAVVAELRDLDPDLVVVSPHGMPGLRDSDYLKAAKALHVPTAVAVASWDNLSSKQLLHEQPQRLLVWNETQKREAIELHAVAGERVVVTGAQNFDLWFEWQPRERRAFCERVGLDPDRPYVLYVGGSLYRTELTEAEWARQWLSALRASDDPLLASAGVLLRPHPRRAAEWLAVSYDDLGDAVVWPRETAGEIPLSADARADFYDSIYHSAAVVGLNTSALLEAAIIGRSVHIPLVADFDASQQSLVHFDYLLSVGGGLPRSAHSLDEHLGQLAETLHGLDATAQVRRRRFLEAFIRPHGLDRPATPIFVDALEDLARTPPARERLPLRLAVARGLLALVLLPPESLVLLWRFLRRHLRPLYYRLRARPRGLYYRWKKSIPRWFKSFRRRRLRPLVRIGRRIVRPARSLVRWARRFVRRLKKRLLRRERLRAGRDARP